MAGATRRSVFGWLASGAIHAGACAIAACIGLSLPFDAALPLLDSAWTPEEPAVEAFEDSVVLSDESSEDPGGRIQEGSAFADEAPSSPSAERSLTPHPAAIPIEAVQAEFSQGDLLTKVSAPRAFRGAGGGAGNGVGGGFFGQSSHAVERIVYVVDNSKSMNYPHASEARTRFNRVKIELVNSIWHMDEHQQFYVIFFNSEAVPMPTSKMQKATPAAKERYLTWIANVRATGFPTDPRQAIKLALSFEPDIIYFLTDGEFRDVANRPLLKIRQDHTVINTFAFGDEISVNVMSSIAKNNGGKFTVIP